MSAEPEWANYALAEVWVYATDETLLWDSTEGGLLPGATMASVGEWVLTAFNPEGRVVSPDQNASASADLVATLRARGIEFSRALGGTPPGAEVPHHEESVAFHAAPRVVCDLARRFGQDAVFRLGVDVLEVVDAAGEVRVSRVLR